MLCKETCKVLFSLSLTNPVSLVYNGYTIEPNSTLAYDPPNLSKWDLFWRSPFGKVLSFRLFVAATVLAVACPGFRELYIGAVTGTVITLCLGGAISGWSRKKNGGEFWEGFACYINENWSQTLAISMALSLVTFGISQAVTAVRAASANKQLANAATQPSDEVRFKLANWGQSATGRRNPYSLKEKLAMEQAISDPLAGKQLPVNMTDPRWMGTEGWIKMQQTFNFYDGSSTTIHYVLNQKMHLIDDFKFVFPL